MVRILMGRYREEHMGGKVLNKDDVKLTLCIPILWLPETRTILRWSCSMYECPATCSRLLLGARQSALAWKRNGQEESCQEEEEKWSGRELSGRGRELSGRELSGSPRNDLPRNELPQEQTIVAVTVIKQASLQWWYLDWCNESTSLFNRCTYEARR